MEKVDIDSEIGHGKPSNSLLSSAEDKQLGFEESSQTSASNGREGMPNAPDVRSKRRVARTTITTAEPCPGPRTLKPTTVLSNAAAPPPPGLGLTPIAPPPLGFSGEWPEMHPWYPPVTGAISNRAIAAMAQDRPGLASVTRAGQGQAQGTAAQAQPQGQAPSPSLKNVRVAHPASMKGSRSDPIGSVQQSLLVDFGPPGGPVPFPAAAAGGRFAGESLNATAPPAYGRTAAGAGQLGSNQGKPSDSGTASPGSAPGSAPFTAPGGMTVPGLGHMPLTPGQASSFFGSSYPPPPPYHPAMGYSPNFMQTAPLHHGQSQMAYTDPGSAAAVQAIVSAAIQSGADPSLMASALSSYPGAFGMGPPGSVPGGSAPLSEAELLLISELLARSRLSGQ